MNNNIDYIEINPETSPVASLIWLHGLGADGNDFAPVATELTTSHSLPPLRFVLPHAPFQPVTINQGYVMRAWYDIVSLESDRHADPNGIRKSVRQINQLIEQEKSRGIGANRIILAGFSQGAVIATATSLNYPESLGGLLALSGCLPFPESEVKTLPPANRSLPVFIGHGTEDEIVPVSLGEKMFQVLNQAGYPAIWHTYSMSHSVCPKEIRDIANWLKNILGQVN